MDLEAKYRSYKYHATRRGLLFTLSYDKFIELLSNPCDYCGMTFKIGLDRVDNSKGYINGNCVACCKTCNYMKRTMSVDDFIRHCKEITDYNTVEYKRRRQYKSG